MKKIAILGYGYVGKAMNSFIKDHYEAVIYDPYLAKEGTISTVTKNQINKCHAAFICVPTPMSDDGSCDISIVEDIFKWLDVEIVIIKSTVAVGTTQKLIDRYGKHIIFSPEYVGESTYWTPFNFHHDMKETPFYTFGGDKEFCSKVIDLFLPITGPCKTYNITDSTTAEMAKYMENAFYATKVAFCNELYSVCESIGVDWNEVRELWLSDPRLHRMHTAVFRDNRGFGGKCLPKDTNALIKIAENAGINPHLLQGVLKSNIKIRQKKA